MDSFYVAYFLLHIAITLLVDAGIALPQSWLLGMQQKMLNLHMEMNNDPLIAERPAWLQAFVWVELLLQTPFFVWAAYDLSRGRKRVWPAVLVYGVEASTTTLGCLATVMAADLEVTRKWKLIWLYGPYLLIPLCMAYDFYGRIAHELIDHRKRE